MKTVYLLGKMTCLSLNEMSGWRIKATEFLESKGYRVLNPVKTDINQDTEPGLVVSSNTMMIDDSDIILAELTSTVVSVGSIAEIGYSHANRKPIVAFCCNGLEDDGPYYTDHPWIIGTVARLTTTLDHALDAIVRAYPAK